MNQPQPNWFAVIAALQSSARHELDSVKFQGDDPILARDKIHTATLLLHLADALRAGITEPARRPAPGDLIDAS